MPAPLLNIISFVEPVVPLLELIQGLVEPSDHLTAFTLLRGRITWAIFDRLIADSQLYSSMPFLTASDYLWAQ
jgi:hypothetical protein